MTGSTSASNAITSFRDLPDLLSERLGGVAMACSDDFFAGMENLVKDAPARWDEHAYTDRGKWMDGWESRRGHKENDPQSVDPADWCILRLGAAGIVRGVVVDTAYFRGNFPAHARIEAVAADGNPTAAELIGRSDWEELLDKRALAGNAQNAFEVTSRKRFTHLRLWIYPDGGVARLRVHGEALPEWRHVGGLGGELELSSGELGGLVESCSDMFFGSRHNLIYPGRGTGMHDGWETRRSRRKGYDWAVIKLAARGRPTRFVVDTAHFKGNFPESFALDGVDLTSDGAHKPQKGQEPAWREIFPRTTLQQHTRHIYVDGIDGAPVSHVRLRIFPDGGLSRFRLFGRLDEDSQSEERARRLSAMPAAEALQTFLTCCGAAAWARAMVASGPFTDDKAVRAIAELRFDALSRTDWLEAFAAHPPIGGKKPPGAATAQSQALSSREQQGVAKADTATQDALRSLNEQYRDKHGFVFIVKATGKTAEEMRALLEQRLHNDTDTEVKNAAAEQRLITALRLSRLFT